ncbi:MAG: hypothetical protein U0270_05965 [Labilithrix sp.]
MKTPARSEGSVQFSLGELMKLEDERIAEQAREREANERAVALAAAEAERQARLVEEARVRADQEAETRRRHAELDELARREAMQKATVEQARLEVEARARAEERERERRHELELQSARAAAPRPANVGSLLAATGLGGVLMLVVTCVLHFGVTQPANDRRFAELELRASTAENKLLAADANAERSRKTIASLERKTAELEAENTRLTKDAASTPAIKKGAPPSAHPTVAPAKPKAETTCVDERDPMCFTIKRAN